MGSKQPLLTVLNYSGGRQSSAIGWMVLRGEIPRPTSFVVLNADPGMENSLTYDYVHDMRARFLAAGIPFHTVDGPNLYQDLVSVRTSQRTRIDNPPYWTRSATGKLGRLRQKCTQVYKIAPMDRAIRQILSDQHGISRNSKTIGAGTVVKWIGFSYDEVARIKPSRQKYVHFQYPLIDLKMRNADVLQYFRDRALPIPPRSVCNACFANGIDHLRTMHRERPRDWAQAVAVDNAVRDLSGVGVDDEVYVSKTLRSLTELAEADFVLEGEDADKWSCDSGYCFT